MRVDLDRATAIATTAIDKGGQFIRPRTMKWDVAGKCSNPVYVQINGRPTRKPLPAVGRTRKGKLFVRAAAAYDPSTVMREGAPQPLWIDIEAGCRKCPACLRKRGIYWRERAKVEINCAARTWFGTLTFSPQERWLMECRTMRDLSACSEGDRFALLHRANGPLLTNYVKRLRKAAGRGLRILCVAEAHKDGVPHYHLFVHEQHGAASITHRELTEQWPHGFSKWKLVADGDRAASYVAKYLFKSALARVRASARYGDSSTALGHSGGPKRMLPPACNEIRKSPQKGS